MIRSAAVAILLLSPGAALAQDQPPASPASESPLAPSAQGEVAVTIYSNDQALVQDVRRLNLPAGVSRQDFPDVANQIRPETVRLSAPGTEVVEQNFDYDLLSPQALIQKAVGQTVTLIRTNPATGAETREQAKILAANGGVVMQIGGRIEVLREDGLPVRVVYASLPPNLRARPTLSVTLDAASGGPRPVTLAYLTRGLGWKADYVTLFDEAKQTIDVQGWVTLNNQGEVPFVNADTVLVAGQPGGSGNARGYAGDDDAPRVEPGTETAGRARLGDFYLYPLARRTTIAANQQKQVSFLSVGGVPATKGYRFVNDWLGNQGEAQSAATVLQFSSSRSGGLGDALPAGTVRVYIRDARGQPQFIGESMIGHTPMGSKLALTTGQAFDVKVKATIDKRDRILSDEWERTASYRISKNGGPATTIERSSAVTYWRTTMRYTLTNARPGSVVVEVVQAGLDNYWQDTRVSNESQPGEQVSRDQRVWRVSVPANGTATLTATFDTRY